MDLHLSYLDRQNRPQITLWPFLKYLQEQDLQLHSTKSQRNRAEQEKPLQQMQIHVKHKILLGFGKKTTKEDQQPRMQ